jgi:hypothetical protein
MGSPRHRFALWLLALAGCTGGPISDFPRGSNGEQSPGHGAGDGDDDDDDGDGADAGTPTDPVAGDGDGDGDQAGLPGGDGGLTGDGGVPGDAEADAAVGDGGVDGSQLVADGGLSDASP